MEAELYQTETAYQTRSDSHISVFLSHYSLNESREALWNLLKAAVTGNYARLPHLERDNLVCFYEELDELLQFVYYRHQEDVNHA